MNTKEALSILRPETNDKEGLKKSYRKMCFKYHPDHGGSLEQMQLVNLAYETLSNMDIWWSQADAKKAAGETPLTEQIRKVVDQIKNFEDVKFELIGTWLWVSGNTYVYRKQLKEAGLKFSRNKQSWYFHTGGYRKFTKKKFDMNDIRTMWGATDVDVQKNAALA